MNSRFDILQTAIPGLSVIQRKLLGDHRGYLERMFCREDLQTIWGDREIIQINHTLTEKRGTVRGLHFQRPPHSECKFVSCLRGAVWDVAVDLRTSSSTYLQWHAEVLSAENHQSLAIPEGFAHGFQTLTDNCEMLYFHSAAYHPGAEDALHAMDPALAIAWPEPITDLSVRDASHPMISATFQGIHL